jgi:ABC-type lipoprotein export system ATPase subunit
VLYKGTRLSNLPSLDDYRSRQVGFIFQAFHLLPTLTALQNVQMPMFETIASRHHRREKAEALLKKVWLEHHQHKYPSQLSAGERQRVAIARSLANDPEILLADEPTGNLDTESTEMILDLLSRIQSERQMTVLVVTHEHDVAARAKRLVQLRDGRIYP